MINEQKQNYFKEIHKLNEYFRLSAEVLLKKRHLNYGAYIVLNSIFDNPDITQYKIAKTTGFSVQRVHQIVNMLEERDLLIRVNISKYKKQLQLTSQGNEVVNTTESELTAQFKAMFRDQQALVDTLSQSIKAMNQYLNTSNVGTLA
ncbi:MAG: MarR family transcriptional regulator [Moritella sp.]|uniref:MarR family winged helix-turn-helix transcriptional regulator n=1 Tax=Moritella sp. TaxID=78556 RepID=UPI0029B56C51|nr:MarR family transcriptional regulator [Moritella sp.]MDX2322052.1 MarR family transcriptional regulator [Moritella sp.]